MTEAKVIAQRYEIDLSIVEKALANIESGKVLFLTISGKIGAGKDTVAPPVVEKLGYKNAQHTSFAKPLRDEVNMVIDFIREADSLNAANSLVKERLSASNYEVVTSALYDDVKNGVVETAYDRTDSTRTALQWWGTEVRRAQDENYWVKRAMAHSFKLLSEGESIYVTDSRFPNEADAITESKGYLVRLHVSEEEQARRIFSRDGKAPDKKALQHISETAMDDYVFEIEIFTDKLTLDEVISESIARIKEKSKTLHLV